MTVIQIVVGALGMVPIGLRRRLEGISDQMKNRDLIDQKLEYSEEY